MSKFIRIAGAAFALSVSLAASPAFAADPVAVVDLHASTLNRSRARARRRNWKAIGGKMSKRNSIRKQRRFRPRRIRPGRRNSPARPEQQASAELEKDQALKGKYVTYVQRTNALLQKGELRRGEMQATEQNAVQGRPSSRRAGRQSVHDRQGRLGCARKGLGCDGGGRGGHHRRRAQPLQRAGQNRSRRQSRFDPAAKITAIGAGRGRANYHAG